MPRHLGPEFGDAFLGLGEGHFQVRSLGKTPRKVAGKMVGLVRFEITYQPDDSSEG